MTSSFLASRRLTVFLLLAIVGAIFIGVTAVSQTRGQGRVQFDSTTALLTSNRTGLSICVESRVTDVKGQIVQNQLARAVTQIGTHPDFRPAGLGKRAVRVDVGCPSEPTIFDTDYDKSLDLFGLPSAPAEPSQYRTFVFLISEEQMAQAFGDRPLPTTAHEVLCTGGTCYEVTTALYLTLHILNDPGRLVEYLAHSIGLWLEGEPTFEPEWKDPRGK